MKTSEVRKEMVDALKEGVATVTFTKKDGTERVMMATLQEELLPRKPIVDTSVVAKRKVNEDIIAVFDTEANGFRSFRVDTVISFFSPRVAMGNVQGLFN
jgi:hypothetical protein